MLMILRVCLLLLVIWAVGRQPADAARTPPSWEILPIPRFVDYGSSKSFVAAKNIAIVRREGSPYQTLRGKDKRLVGASTVTEEELTSLLKASGAAKVLSVRDDLKSYEGFDTLVLLGSPEHNSLTSRVFGEMKLSFGRWDDRNTPDDDFTTWKDLGKEGYILKVGRSGGKNIVILAGYDYDDAAGRFYGAGTYYALQSFAQLLVSDGESLKIKTAEIADKPLLEIRAAYSYFDQNFDCNVVEPFWRTTEASCRAKMNQSIIWYGNPVLIYQAEAAAKFRYPWRPEQLKFFADFGRYCQEHFVSVSMCINADHYGVDWAAPKTFDGSRKDPLHYDPNYRVEPQFKEMWAEAGYDVSNDIDILAAKFAQANKAIGGGLVACVMNEDDGFGLIHPEDKKLFNTETGDPKQDSINYGKARAQFFATFYKRLREIAPDIADMVPMDPPAQLAYQQVLDRNEGYSREFLTSFSSTLKELGILDKIPIITTGGGTAAEVVTNEQIDNYKNWCSGGRVLICDNNFPFGFHIGAYETDPKAPHSPNQISKDYPAGYRDKDLYKRLLGIQWNGINDQNVLLWCMGNYMWNMLGHERARINELATRKVTTERSYRIVKTFYEEFDQPACYLPDNQPPLRLKPISKRIVLTTRKGNDWQYDLTCTDALRLECQGLRDRLSKLMPQVEAVWENKLECKESLRGLGANALGFCSVFLAYGYITGWEGLSSKDVLSGERLMDLYLEADDLQERFFAGPDVVPGKTTVVRNGYSGSLPYIYKNGLFKNAPATPKEADWYVDIWKDGLMRSFLKSIASVVPADIADGDSRLAGSWGSPEGSGADRSRTVTGEVSVKLDVPAGERVLIRVRLGTDAATFTDATPIGLATGAASHADAVCKPRWISWMVPAGACGAELKITSGKPVRVYAVETYQVLKGAAQH